MQICPKAIIGLGNPGYNYFKTRHNIGFRVLDALAEKFFGEWRLKDNMEMARISINNNPVLLIKPQTYMNNSGAVIPYILKQNIKSDQILVVHDELEMPFGKLAIRLGGSARGHNGLRSLMANTKEDFSRLRFGIGRPESKEDVSNYVLQNFAQSSEEIKSLVDQSISMIEDLYTQNC